MQFSKDVYTVYCLACISTEFGMLTCQHWPILSHSYTFYLQHPVGSQHRGEKRATFLLQWHQGPGTSSRTVNTNTSCTALRCKVNSKESQAKKQKQGRSGSRWCKNTDPLPEWGVLHIAPLKMSSLQKEKVKSFNMFVRPQKVHVMHVSNTD